MPGNAYCRTLGVRRKHRINNYYDVVVVKNTLQTTLRRSPTRQEIRDKFHSNVKLADGRQEGYSENFAKDAMTMYERILSVPSLANIIVEQEKRDGQNSLWNNIGRTAVLASNTADQVKRKWAMDSLEDYQINHSYISSHLSNHILQ